MRTPAGSLPQRRDVLVAGGCWLVVLGVLATMPLLAATDSSLSGFTRPGTPAWWACAATFTAQAVALVWARRAPRATVLLVSALPLPLATTGPGDAFSLSSAAVTVAVLLTVLLLPLRTMAPALVAAAVLVAAGEVVHAVSVGTPAAPALVTGVLQALGAVGAPLLLATAITGRREARVAREHEQGAVAREQEALVRAAVADERTAMARELHDIAAHHMSGIALMASAIERQIDTDPQTAKRSVRQVRAQSTAVLEDLRRLVGLLRDETEATRSVLTLEAVAELVEQRRAAGATVELRVLRAADGGRLGAGTGPLAQLALYRIVQEALANAARHAPGTGVVVEVDDRSAQMLTLSVTNGAGGHVTHGGRGFGLVGMRERAELVGATLHHGPTPDGGWSVRVVLPRDADHHDPGPGQEETT
ncbi:sensor histidine kinase [Auraticoccus sp. F435]|uniref:histidine kinase n=1 Tax=Auraticoccus cholistanensis TaxID=2656650 RepID=A0A6A9UY01_9ACTN|nr:sensor histidine kinase [Auraticoccus cholistanensis]